MRTVIQFSSSFAYSKQSSAVSKKPYCSYNEVITPRIQSNGLERTKSITSFRDRFNKRENSKRAVIWL